MTNEAEKTRLTVLTATAFTAAVLAVGYILLGWVPLFLFAFGYVGGLAIWLLVPSRATYRDIRLPYFIALVLFVAHKAEERHFEFFPALAQITGVVPPEAGTPMALLLYALASAWLFVPLLMRRGYAFGHYLAWTFFTSMGVTELAHFVFPFFTLHPFGYFPGMATTVVLAPVAWWGMARMAKAPR
jgi:hypothetical protein